MQRFTRLRLFKVINDWSNKNIAIATTFKILLFALLLALIISLVSFVFIKNYQTKSIETSIKQLALTVEKTASIATFTNDVELAREVAQGLMNNKVLSGVRLLSDKQELFAEGVFSESPIGALYKQSLFSPFDAKQLIGELQIEINQNEIFAQSYRYAKLISLILFALIVAISFGLSLAINFNIIKPIQFIVDRLHHMNPEDLTDIPIPSQHAQDEIGRLVTDINALTQQQKALLISEKELRLEQESAQKRIQLIFEKNRNGLFLADYALNLSSWNSAFEEILSKHHRELVSAERLPNLMSIFQGHADELQHLLNNVLSGKAAQSLVIHILQNDLSQWVELTLQVMDEQYLQGIVADVSNIKQAEMLALAIAEQDPLTGLLNRRGFELRLLQNLADSRLHQGTALCMLDLDGFKAVNDTFGHYAGDFVLKEISARLQSSLRSGEVIARLGGDEFAVIISNVKDVLDVEKIAQKLLEQISPPILFENHALIVGASIGISISSGAHQDLGILLKQADSAMYQAKNLGKGQFFTYQPV